jgi:hypothetical protein
MVVDIFILRDCKILSHAPEAMRQATLAVGDVCKLPATRIVGFGRFQVLSIFFPSVFTVFTNSRVSLVQVSGSKRD